MPFHVDMSAKVAKEFSQLKRRGSQIGLGREVRVALHSIVERLRQSPDDFGEAAEELPILRLHVRSAFLNPVAVRFAVQHEQQLVYIMKVTLPQS